MSRSVLGVHVSYSAEDRHSTLPSQALSAAFNARMNTFKRPLLDHFHTTSPMYPMFFLDEIDQLLKTRFEFAWHQLGQIPQVDFGQAFFSTVTSSSSQMQRMIKNPRAFFTPQESAKGPTYLPNFQSLNGDRYPPLALLPALDTKSLQQFLESLPNSHGTAVSESKVKQVFYDTGGAWGSMFRMQNGNSQPSFLKRDLIPAPYSLDHKVLVRLVMKFFQLIAPKWLQTSPSPSLRDLILEYVNLFSPPTISRSEIEGIISLSGSLETTESVIERLVDIPIIREHSPDKYCLTVPAVIEQLVGPSLMDAMPHLRPTKSEASSDLHLIAQAIASKDAVVVVGTGVSSALSSSHHSVSWIGLLKDGLKHYQAHEIPDPDNHIVIWLKELDNPSVDLETQLTIGDFLKSHRPLFDNWIKRVNAVPLSPSSKLGHIIADLHVPIITTNYDTLLSQVTTLPVVTWNSSLSKVRDHLKGGRSIFHLHGSCLEPDSVVIGHEDYRALLDNDRVAHIRSMVGNFKTCIFIGFGAGLNDPHFKHIFDTMHKVWGSDTHAMHYQLVRGHNVPESSSVLRQVSYGQHFDDLPAFLTRLFHVAEFYRSRSSR